MFHEAMNGPFVADYRCYSVSMMPGQDRQDLEKGGKSQLLQNAYLLNISFMKHLSVIVSNVYIVNYSADFHCVCLFCRVFSV